jgi:hypothetical protein
MFLKEWWFYIFAQHNWWWLIIAMIIFVVITSVMNDNVKYNSSIIYFIIFCIAVLLRIICSLVTIAAIIFALFGGNFAIDNVNMKDIKDLNIQVDSNKVVIEKLPNRYSYEKLDDGKELKANVKQQFKYEVNEFNSSYLVSEDGGKIKLNEEDTKFLKEKGVK